MKSDHATDFEFLVRQDKLHHCVIEQVRRINENKNGVAEAKETPLQRIENSGGNGD